MLVVAFLAGMATTAVIFWAVHDAVTRAFRRR